jgi:hypothetical protein
MRVLAYDPYPNRDRAGQNGIEYVEMNALLQESDIGDANSSRLPKNACLLSRRDKVVVATRLSSPKSRPGGEALWHVTDDPAIFALKRA